MTSPVTARPDGGSTGWMASLDPATWRAVRRAALAIAAVPMLVLIASRIPNLPNRGIFGIYGLAVVSSTLVSSSSGTPAGEQLSWNKALLMAWLAVRAKPLAMLGTQ